MADELYVKVGSTIEPVALEADTAPEFVERIEAVEEAVPALDSSLRAFIAEEVAKCYPKSGGVLGGTIIRNGFLAQNSVDDNLLIIRGGTDATSAFLGLCGKNYAANPGLAYLFASDGTNSATFSVAPNGTAKVAGNNVITSAGGTMYGQIIAANLADFIKRNVNNDRLTVWGGDHWERCAYLELFGGDNTGRVQLNARDGKNGTFFVVYPNGQVLVNGNPVLTLVASWRSGDNWYRKYSDGWIEQGGTFSVASGSNNRIQSVSLHTPFASSAYNVHVQAVSNATSSDYNNTQNIENKYTTTFSVRIQHGQAGTFNWYACG